MTAKLLNSCSHILPIFCGLVLYMVSPDTSAQGDRMALTQEILDATDAFLDTLAQPQRDAATFDFDAEERLNWHFIPRERQGAVLKELNEGQRLAAVSLLQTLFSAKGFEKTEQVRSLESVLAALEVNGRFDRDPELYYISIFGNPALESDWAVRYEGHHLAFNWTFVGGQGIASTPQFFGSNPAEVKQGPRQGFRALAAEEDLARSLLLSLDQTQLEKAILEGEAPGDIYTAAAKEVSPLLDTGIAYGELNPAQQQALLKLVEEIAMAQPDLIASERMTRIRQEGLEHITFSWIGGTNRGDPHYYNVQGPSFLIEYDNTQNDANHIHLVWRDFSGDFGRDLIRMHYDAVATEHGPGHSH